MRAEHAARKQHTKIKILEMEFIPFIPPLVGLANRLFNMEPLSLLFYALTNP